MNKPLLFLLSLLFAMQSFPGLAFQGSDPRGVSVKAGPTDPAEGVSIAWIETALYPRNVERGRDMFIEVKLTSKVSKVNAVIDLGKRSETLELFSDDGLSWSRVCRMPLDMSPGIHVARINIQARNGRRITRTLDFAVVDHGTFARQPEFELTVLKNTPVVEDGERVRQLLPGVKVTAVYKAPFYRVRLSDGKEGWVNGAFVQEPTEELYMLGFRAFKARDFIRAEENFSSAVKLEPTHVNARLWLSKTYDRLGKESLAIAELKEALKLDPINQASAEFRRELSSRYYASASTALAKGDRSGALVEYKKLTDLDPMNADAWVKLGETHRVMGSLGDARLAWREGLRAEPENARLLAALGIGKARPETRTAAIPPARSQTSAAAPAQEAKPVQVRSAAAKDFVRESIEMVGSSKTRKGTAISSALKSVMALTRSMGTKIYEDGWNVTSDGGGFMVQFACRQDRNGKAKAENFEWKIDPDSRRVTAMNENARLLMSRW